MQQVIILIRTKKYEDRVQQLIMKA